MDHPVGYGFRPSDAEVVHHLRNKIEGKNELEGEISEVNIYSYDPWDLRRQYKHKTRDLVWYYFNKYGTGNRQSRTTPSGKWKLTGESVDVKEDQRGIYFGRPQSKIGHKRVLVFLEGRNSEKKSDWVIHEFHYDLLLENQMTYVVCRLEYKGNDKRYLFDNPTDPTPTLAPNASEGSVVNQSRQGNSGSYSTFPEYNSPNQGQWLDENSNMQQSIQRGSGSNDLCQYPPYYGQQFGENFYMQPSVEGYSQSFPEYDLTNPGQWSSDYHNLEQPAPYLVPNDYDSDIILNCVNGVNLDSLGEERTFMQENFSNYRPPQPVTGVFSDDSDSDSDSDSTIFGATSTSTDSIGRSNDPHHTSIHDIPSPNTIDPLPTHDAPEQPNQLNMQLQSREQVINTQQSECDWKMAEDSIRKTPSTNTVKQSWVALEKKRLRNAKRNYLKNMIIGILLFIYIIGWIILVH